MVLCYESVIDQVLLCVVAGSTEAAGIQCGRLCRIAAEIR